MTDSISQTADVVLTNHRVVRDGSLWACLHCKSAWPYPQPLPTPTEPCVPRRWDDAWGVGHD